MKGNLQQALDNTETAYSQLVVIANDIVGNFTKDIDKLIKEAYDNINGLNNDNLRHLIITLSLKSYSFADIKEKSALKVECAEALRKEAYAVEYNKADGAVAARENIATINISDEVMTEAVYNLVAGLFKTKLQEIHAIIDALRVVLTTRISESKLANNLD